MRRAMPALRNKCEQIGRPELAHLAAHAPGLAGQARSPLATSIVTSRCSWQGAIGRTPRNEVVVLAARAEGAGHSAESAHTSTSTSARPGGAGGRARRARRGPSASAIAKKSGPSGPRVQRKAGLGVPFESCHPHTHHYGARVQSPGRRGSRRRCRSSRGTLRAPRCRAATASGRGFAASISSTRRWPPAQRRGPAPSAASARSVTDGRRRRSRAWRRARRARRGAAHAAEHQRQA